MKILSHLFILCLFSSSVFAGDSAVEFTFFEEPVSVCYDSRILKNLGSEVDDRFIVDYFNMLEHSDYYCSFRDLYTVKKDLKLNDWLYYLLIKQTAESIYGVDNPNYSNLFAWFFLAKSGFKVQLNYNAEEILLSVYTEDMVYDIPSKIHGEGWLVEISSFQKTRNEKMLVTIRSNFYFNINGKAFSFQLDELPEMTNRELENKEIRFIHDGKPYSVHMSIDLSMMHMMYNYPELSVKSHERIPLSKNAALSLLPALHKITSKMTTKEALNFLLSFTRLGTKYKVDEEAYRRTNVTFSAEEGLFYDYTDCEDRSVMFSYLTTQLLGLSTVLLDFDDHVGVAVKLEECIGKPIMHNGECYTYCEATDVLNNLGLGEYPEILKGKEYIILDR